MFGLGFSEIIVIVIAALIFIGPKQLPEFVKSAGRFFVQVRRATNEVKSTMDGVMKEAEAELQRESEAIKSTVNTKAISQTISDLEQELGIQSTNAPQLPPSRSAFDSTPPSTGDVLDASKPSNPEKLDDPKNPRNL